MKNHDSVVSTSNLTKYYGKQRGIEAVNMEVKRGEVFGYLGPNGAGKTTTIRILLDFIRPSSGSVSVFGFDSRNGSVEARRHIGYLPGELSMYGNLTGHELLRYVASLRGGFELTYAVELAKRMDCDLTRRLKTLSHGNRQKLGLIHAFMHKPPLIILDEPTIGLDPLMQQEFYRLIEEARDDGRTVFLSSHILPEVERVCDRVGIIRSGKLAAIETIETLKSHAVRRLEIHFASTVPANSFQSITGVRDLAVSENVLKCIVTGSLDSLIKAVSKYEVVNVISHEPSLEEVFLTYYGGGKPDA
jgi:ABC-2 type transport system ATP-binding protein